VKILFIGTEDLLDWTRRQVLASTGYEVVDGGSGADAGALNSDASLAVISSLIDTDEQERIAEVLRSKSPETLVIILRKDSATVGDMIVPPLSDPNELLKQVGVALMKQHHHPEVSSPYFLYVDRNRRYINVSDGVCELTKWRREEILGKKIEWLTYPESADAPAMFQQYLENGRMAGHYQLRSRSGEPVRVRFAAAVLADGCMCSELFPE
jgi:PAS domain S-box-containing protein